MHWCSGKGDWFSDKTAASPPHSNPTGSKPAGSLFAESLRPGLLCSSIEKDQTGGYGWWLGDQENARPSENGERSGLHLATGLKCNRLEMRLAGRGNAHRHTNSRLQRVNIWSSELLACV